MVLGLQNVVNRVENLNERDLRQLAILPLMRRGVGGKVRRRSGLGENGRRRKNGEGTMNVGVADQEAHGEAMIMMTMRTTDGNTGAEDPPPKLEVEAEVETFAGVPRAVHHHQSMMTTGS